MKRAICIGYLLLPILVLAVCAPASRADGGTPQVAAAIRIGRLFTEYHPDSAGYAIGITQNGKLVYQKYFGLANVSYHIPIDADSVFNVGSVSKQFTAACIALLQMHGKLSVNDSITKYLPGFPAAYAGVKIKDLIYHTGGIRQWEMLEMLAGRNSERDHYTNDAIVALLKRQKGLNFKPGEHYLYSNGGYMLLAEIIKRVSGMSLKEYARQNIFAPLGMSHTFFVDDQQQLFSHKVTGYRRNDDKSLYECIDENDSYGGGNLHTTVPDLSKWESNYVHSRLAYGDSLIKLLLTEGKLTDGTPVGYGFGIELEKYHGLKVISHTGYWPGFRTRILIIPELNYSVTFITNSSDDIHTDHTAFDIAEAYSPQLFHQAENTAKSAEIVPPAADNAKSQTVASYTPEQLKQFVGVYYSEEINTVFRIKAANDHLVLQIDDDDLDLSAKQSLVFSFQDGMTFSFMRGKQQIDGFTLDVGDDVKGLYFSRLTTYAP